MVLSLHDEKDEQVFSLRLGQHGSTAKLHHSREGRSSQRKASWTCSIAAPGPGYWQNPLFHGTRYAGDESLQRICLTQQGISRLPPSLPAQLRTPYFKPHGARESISAQPPPTSAIFLSSPSSLPILLCYCCAHHRHLLHIQTYTAHPQTTSTIYTNPHIHRGAFRTYSRIGPFPCSE